MNAALWQKYVEALRVERLAHRALIDAECKLEYAKTAHAEAQESRTSVGDEVFDAAWDEVLKSVPPEAWPPMPTAGDVVGPTSLTSVAAFRAATDDKVES